MHALLANHLNRMGPDTSDVSQCISVQPLQCCNSFSALVRSACGPLCCDSQAHSRIAGSCRTVTSKYHRTSGLYASFPCKHLTKAGDYHGILLINTSKVHFHESKSCNKSISVDTSLDSKWQNTDASSPALDVACDCPATLRLLSIAFSTRQQHRKVSSSPKLQ